MTVDRIDREWTPDWSTHPGEHLAEQIEVMGLTQAEFARLADLTPKLVSTMVAGKNPVTADTALKLERVSTVPASIWTGLQARWDLHQARMRSGRAQDYSDWMAGFPVKELQQRGALATTKDPDAILDSLLSFLGIGSPSAFEVLSANLAVNHRQAKAKETSVPHIVSWLLLGEKRADAMDLHPFDPEAFQAAVHTIRGLTLDRPEIFEPQMRELCARAGVGLVFEKPIKNTFLFGSARWLASGSAVIQMSLRMKSNDHFWWTFFHEAAHIILHRGRTFVDDKGGSGGDMESEADKWAEEMLVGRRRFAEFRASSPRSGAAVKAFASETGIHPGIVVGMLQHAGIVPYDHLNALKVRFDWAN